MTFKDLEKRIRSNPILEQQSKPLFQRLRHKRFWYWNEEQHRQAAIMLNHDCCFNHVIGLPRKEGIEKQIFDYQKLLYDSLIIPAAVKNQPRYSFRDRHLWVKKATGFFFEVIRFNQEPDKPKEFDIEPEEEERLKAEGCTIKETRVTSSETGRTIVRRYS